MEPHVQVREMTAVLPLCPFPSLHWWALARRGAAFDPHESYQKQTMRNRIRIAGPQGPQIITFAVQHSPDSKSWPQLSSHISPKNSWKAIRTAYGNSPFFEHFEEELEALWEQGLPYSESDEKHLQAWAWKTIQWTQKTCGWTFENQVCSESPSFGSCSIDLREKAQLEGVGWNFVRYPQLFESQFSFIPGCSILDGLFIIGPSELNRQLDQLTGLHPS